MTTVLDRLGVRAANPIARAQVAVLQADVPPISPDPDQPHEFNGPGPESDLFDGVCDTCGRPADHPVHVAILLVPDEALQPDAGDDTEVQLEPHAFQPGPDEATCECGKPAGDQIHDVPVTAEEPAYDDGDVFSQLSPSVRKKAAAKGQALPDGSYPIASEADLRNAIQAYGRAKDKERAKRHIVKRARALGKVKLLPDDWNVTATNESTGELADTVNDVTPGARFKIPIVVPEGVTSGDGRTFAEGSLSSRDVPLALMWQIETDDGHKHSVIVGRVDHVERLTEGGLGNAYGVFDTGEHGQEALRLVRAGMLRGISADLDEFEADVLGGGETEDKVTSTQLLVTSGRLMGVTLVAKPAYPQCTIELIDGEDDAVPDGEYEEQTPAAVAASLVAAGAPVAPPRAWFANPRLDKLTPLTITDDGQVFGHIASWSTRHIGLPYGTRPPRSLSNYAYFRTGVLRTAEGDDVPVGQLTLAGGHAPLQADARTAVKHYDDTASAWADVAAGEDRHGIWVAGSVRPDVTAAQVRVARASSPSGDWRPIDGTLELVAACCVNVPGFPVARAMVASGVVTALVAAGCVALEAQPTSSDLVARLDALEAAERRRVEATAKVARDRVRPFIMARHEALTAAAAAARERVTAVRSERDAHLARAKAELVARVAAGVHEGPDFNEKLHPRDDAGKFRVVLGRLHDLLSGDLHDDAVRDGLSRVEDAVGKADAGDHVGASDSATEGAKRLTDAAEKASGEVKARLTDAAREVRDAVGGTGNRDGGDHAAGDVLFEELSQEAKELLLEAVDRAEQHLDPANPDELLRKVKAFISGTNTMDPNDVANFVKNQLKRPFVPTAPDVGP